jgi:DDE superfamily endonuclease
MKIIPQNNEKLNNSKLTIDNFFNSINFGSLLKKSNFYKSKGVPCLSILKYLFSLIFTHKNFYRHLETNETEFGKDTVYRFLNSIHYNWKELIASTASIIINEKIKPLTKRKREKVFIFDDSIYERGRSKQVELLSRVHDHNDGKYKPGFQMLTLAWSDGNSTIPVAFNMVASSKEKNQLCKMNDSIDKRTNGFKRRNDALKAKTESMFDMLDTADKHNINADYVLFDSWFSSPSTILRLLKRNMHTIAMVKLTKKVHYVVDGLHKDVKQIYKGLKKKRRKGDIIKSIIVHLEDKENSNKLIPVQLVFVKNKNKKNDWLALISTDTKIKAEEVVRIYGKRWNIEVFFKTCKSYLKLAKEFQSRSYDAIVAHTSIVFIRYMMLSLEERNTKDDRTIGNLFYLCCDELQDIKFIDSITLLLNLIKNEITKHLTLSKESFNAIFDSFMLSLPSHIKINLGFISCES